MMKRLSYLLVLLQAIFSTSCKGQIESKSTYDRMTGDQKTEKQVDPYHYGAGDVVFRGYLDKSGNMWFTTSGDGVFIYDGERFTNITEKDGLCSNQVNAIVEDDKGTMWFGTNKGLCGYDGKNFIHIPLPIENSDDVSPETGLPSRQTETILSIIQAENGDFWIGTDAAGAYHYNGKNFTSYLKFKGRIQPNDSVYNNCITNIVEDKNGHIWICSFTHGGLNQFNGTEMIHHPLKDGFGDGMISTGYKDDEGNLWFGTRNGGIYKYDYNAFENIADTKTGEQIAMASILKDARGNIWIGSFARKGVYTYEENMFIPFSMKGSENLNDIKFISEDADGNIWFGGRYGLLWRFDGKELKDFTQLKRI